MLTSNVAFPIPVGRDGLLVAGCRHPPLEGCTMLLRDTLSAIQSPCIARSASSCALAIEMP